MLRKAILAHSTKAHPPREIARLLERLGVAKARTDTITLVALAVLAGAFISLGALFFTVVVTKASLGFGITRLVGGLSFCLGLVLVVVAGAEPFTGNNLLAMAWASRLIGTFFLPFGMALDGHGVVSAVGAVRNLIAVTAGNIVGGTLLVAGVYWVAYLRGERKREDNHSS